MIPKAVWGENKRMKITFEDIQKAQAILKGIAYHTPLVHSEWLSKKYGIRKSGGQAQVHLKMEHLQLTGSFKIRGAYNRIYSLTEEEKEKGVIASSAGNHAQGVALSAQMLGVSSTIVMPERASLIKVENTKNYGAQVLLFGDVYDDAYKKAREIESQEGRSFVHPFDDPWVVAGQGTLGLEIVQDLPAVDTVIVPIGGGGLIGGIALAIKTLLPKAKIIGVQSEQTQPVYQMFYGQNVESTVRRITTIADGIAVKRPSKDIFDQIIKPYVDQVVTVSDEEIAEAIVTLLERHKTVVEGSGAAALAALMNRDLDLGSNVCVLCCGGNIDLNLIAKVIERGQVRKGRLVELTVIVEDLPGILNNLTKVLAEQGANILDVHHDRVSGGLYLRETMINFVIETVGHEHAERIKEALKRVGARIA